MNDGGGESTGELGTEYAKAFEADRPGELGSGVVLMDGGKGGSIGELIDLAEVPKVGWFEALSSGINSAASG